MFPKMLKIFFLIGGGKMPICLKIEMFLIFLSIFGKFWHKCYTSLESVILFLNFWDHKKQKQKKFIKSSPFGCSVKCPMYHDTNCNCSHPSRLKPSTQKLIFLWVKPKKFAHNQTYHPRKYWKRRVYFIAGHLLT